MNHLYCGTDIANSENVLLLLGPGGQQLDRAVSFNNNPAGHKAAYTWMCNRAKKFKPFIIHVCMEATGIYYLPFAKYLHGKSDGITVSVVNPAQIKAFAKAELKRTKTDAVDAGVIARFAKAMDPVLWTPPAPHEEKILGIVRYMDSLKQSRQAEENRLHALRESGSATEEVQQAVLAIIDAIDVQVKSLEEKLREIIDDHPDISGKMELLCTIPGIGEKTAFGLVAEIGGNITKFSGPKELVAMAGLAPSEHRSGTSVNGRPGISRHGNARYRDILYMATVSAIMHNPVIKEFFNRLKAAGKKGKVAVVACMRKMLHIVYGVLKNQKEFDASLHLPA